MMILSSPYGTILYLALFRGKSNVDNNLISVSRPLAWLFSRKGLFAVAQHFWAQATLRQILPALDYKSTPRGGLSFLCHSSRPPGCFDDTTISFIIPKFVKSWFFFFNLDIFSWYFWPICFYFYSTSLLADFSIFFVLYFFRTVQTSAKQIIAQWHAITPKATGTSSCARFTKLFL